MRLAFFKVLPNLKETLANLAGLEESWYLEMFQAGEFKRRTGTQFYSAYLRFDAAGREQLELTQCDSCSNHVAASPSNGIFPTQIRHAEGGRRKLSFDRDGGIDFQRAGEDTDPLDDGLSSSCACGSITTVRIVARRLQRVRFSSSLQTSRQLSRPLRHSPFAKNARAGGSLSQHWQRF